MVIRSWVGASHYRFGFGLRFCISAGSIILGGVGVVIGSICIGASHHVLGAAVIVVTSGGLSFFSVWLRRSWQIVPRTTPMASLLDPNSAADTVDGETP